MPEESTNSKVIRKMEKKEPCEFNIHEVRGWVIESFQKVESAMDEIITSHFKPANKYIFKQVMLNGSILTIGSKLKILANIESVSKNTIENIREISSIRNGFAHAQIEDVGFVTVHQGPITINLKLPLALENDEMLPIETREETILEVMNGQGKIEMKKAVDYFVKFQGLYVNIEKDLLKLLDPTIVPTHLQSKNLAKTKPK